MILMLLVALSGIISVCGFILLSLTAKVDGLEKEVFKLIAELEIIKRGEALEK